MCGEILSIGKIPEGFVTDSAMACEWKRAFDKTKPKNGWGIFFRRKGGPPEVIKCSDSAIWRAANYLGAIVPSDVEFFGLHARNQSQGEERDIALNQPFLRRETVLRRREDGVEKEFKRWSVDGLERYCVLVNSTVGKARVPTWIEGGVGAEKIVNYFLWRLEKAKEQGDDLDVEEVFARFCRRLEERFRKQKPKTLTIAVLDQETKTLLGYRGITQSPEHSRLFFGIGSENGGFAVISNVALPDNLRVLELDEGQIVILRADSSYDVFRPNERYQ